MNARTMPAVDSSRRSTAILTAGPLLVLSLFVTAAAAQQYAPPGYAPPGYAPPPPAYAPPPAYVPAPPAPPPYAPPPEFAPAPGYGAAPAYTPPPGYAPPPAYAPAPAYAAPQGYAPSGTYSAPPTFAAPPVTPLASTNANPVAGSVEVSDFVSRITKSTRFERSSVARWRVPLCFSVEGLPESENAFVVQRLMQIASGAGARIQSEGCGKGSYNFHVRFTLDADRAAKDWYAQHRDLFDENANSQTEIDRFVDPSTPAPVRVWHNGALFGTDGEPLVRVDPGNPVGSLPDLDSTGSRLPYTGSRLTPPGVIGLNFAVVIVDGTKTNGAGLAPLADYVAMAGLAELNLGADLRDDPTILRLFTAPADVRPSGLTAWDQAFLSALYRMAESPKNLLRTRLAASVAHDVSASPY